MAEILFYGGMALMGLSAIAGLTALVYFRVSGRRLKKQLEAEYGKPRC